MSIVALPVSEMLMLAAALISAGVLTGLLAGLFGVGGGTVIVPVLYEVFRLMGVAEDVRMPLCVGTSLAIIIPTSIRSFRSHLAKGAVDKDVLRIWFVPVVAGVVVGVAVAAVAPAWLFKAVFVVVAGILAIKLLFGGSASGSLTGSLRFKVQVEPDSESDSESEAGKSLTGTAAG